MNNFPKIQESLIQVLVEIEDRSLYLMTKSKTSKTIRDQNHAEFEVEILKKLYSDNAKAISIIRETNLKYPEFFRNIDIFPNQSGSAIEHQMLWETIGSITLALDDTRFTEEETCVRICKEIVDMKIKLNRKEKGK